MYKCLEPAGSSERVGFSPSLLTATVALAVLLPLPQKRKTLEHIFRWNIFFN